MLNILSLEIFSIFHSAGFVFCFVFGSFGPFSLLGFGFLVVYSLYTPWGPFFDFNTIAYLSKKKISQKISLVVKSLYFERV